MAAAKAAAATRPLLGADRVAKFVLGYAGKMHWSESDFQLVTINGAPGLLLRHPIAGDGTSLRHRRRPHSGDLRLCATPTSCVGSSSTCIERGDGIRSRLSCWESTAFRDRRGKAAVVIDEAPDVFEDDDILEMVNAGLVAITVVDDYLAEFWIQVFTGITVHKDAAVRTGGRLAVAFRKDNPRLREAVNNWMRKHQKGDAFRNTIEHRYLQIVKYVKNAAADAERRKLEAVVEIFKK